MPRSAQRARLRRRELTRLLKSGRSVRVTQMARLLGVSAMTIRRDLEALAASGVAVRTYGGAIPAGRISFELAFSERHHQHWPEKRRIGSAAAALIRPGSTVFVDTGTTTLEIARALAGQRIACTVVTSSLVVAAELWRHRQVALLLLGGRVRDGSPDLAGPETQRAVKAMRADAAFLGADAVDASGAFAADAEVARVAALMVRRARQAVVVADASKLGRRAGTRYARAAELDVLITDRRADPGLVTAMKRSGLKVTPV